MKKSQRELIINLVRVKYSNDSLVRGGPVPGARTARHGAYTVAAAGVVRHLSFTFTRQCCFSSSAEQRVPL